MIRYTLPDGQVLNSGQAFRLDGISYPSNWFACATVEDLAALSIQLAVVEPEPQSPPSQEEMLSAVRFEAQRRIIQLMGARDFSHCLIKQLNANARAVALTDKRVLGESLSTEEEAEAQALRDTKAAIDAIRAKSNILEGMDPVPSDYADDLHWV